MQTGSGLQQDGSGRHLKMSGGQHVILHCAAGAMWGGVAEKLFVWQSPSAETTAVEAMVINATTASVCATRDNITLRLRPGIRVNLVLHNLIHRCFVPITSTLGSDSVQMTVKPCRLCRLRRPRRFLSC